MFYGYVKLPEGTLKVSLQLSRSETRVYGDYKYGDVKKGGKREGLMGLIGPFIGGLTVNDSWEKHRSWVNMG